MITSESNTSQAVQFKALVKQRLNNWQSSATSPLGGDHLLNPDIQQNLVDLAVKPAAVLIPLVEREDGLKMIFTKRTEKLKSHSGQVSFPGGKIDAEDVSALSAALRETDEEIGVPKHAVEVLGQMPDYFAGSGYRISPIVGMVNPDVEFTASPHEVEYIFEVPVAFLMNPDNHKISSRVFLKRDVRFYEMPWNEHYIWGVTAGIVRMFYNRMYK